MPFKNTGAKESQTPSPAKASEGDYKALLEKVQLIIS